MATESALNEGEVFLLPTCALYRNDKLDDASDQTSVYSTNSEPAMDESPQDEDLYMDNNEFARRLFQFGFDVNGLPIRSDLIFETFDEAAAFSVPKQEIESSKSSRPLEVPHYCLWDYFGGESCLSTNCMAGDQINVICEEYQVRKLNGIEKHFIRLPMRWSLGHWMTKGKIQPTSGLIPSCWLIEKCFYDDHPRLFTQNTWYLGITDFLTAYDYILERRHMCLPGMFVIFSPLWLNLNARDHRPYLMLVLCSKGINISNNTEVLEKGKSAGILMVNEDHITTGQEGGRIKVTEENVKRQIPENMKAGKKKSRSSKEVNVSGNSEHKDGISSQMDSITKDLVTKDYRIILAKCPFEIKSYTIRRNSLGRYLLFNLQFLTLYDLVHYLTVNPSPLPHKLNYGPPSKFRETVFSAVPSPTESPIRDPCALTMKSEQWAAKHFSQVVEPSLLSQAVKYITRSIFDPFKKVHRRYAKVLRLDTAAIADARAYIAKSTPERNKTAADSNNILTDESVLKTSEAIEINLSDLKFGNEDVLGSGAFGDVYTGRLKISENDEVDVAIKKLRMFAPKTERRQIWITELEILQIINHPNLVRFYGYCYDETKEYVMFAFELMKLKSLADFLKGQDYRISTNEQVDFMIQVARGAAHLHSLDPPISHGDLAIRNVLISHHPKDATRYVLKISDFGLSKITRHEMHYMPDDPNKIPFKWLPPEVLHRREFSLKADIWAYGILVTEMYGVKEPYGMLAVEKVLNFLNDGHRMEKPSTMPFYIYDIVLRCWRKQLVDRPTFPEIIHDLIPYQIESESAHLTIVNSRLASGNELGIKKVKKISILI